MIKLTFSDFAKGNYNEGQGDYFLYILIAESCVLYIGISGGSIWNRWFGNIGSHVTMYPVGKWDYQSEAGEAIVKCFPKSLQWTIELWTFEDCNTFLAKNDTTEYRPSNLPIFLERLMIKHFQPAFNRANANYEHKLDNLPKCIRDYQLANDRQVRKTFDKIHNKGKVKP